MIMPHVWQRTRTVHGWAFTKLTKEDEIKIRRFLMTGDREDLPESYKPIFDVVIEQKK